MDKGVHIMDTLPLCGPPCGHATLAAPKPLMASFLSSVSSSALCVWPSHPHGAFFCRAFPVPAVTSLQVAEIFGKQHANVLRDIEQFLTQQPEIFVEPNFGVIEYPVRRGFGTEMVKAYLLSKDGFPYAGKAFLPAHPAR